MLCCRRQPPEAIYPHETAPSLSLPGSSCGDDSVTCLNLSAENPFESSKGSGTSTQPDVTSTQPDVLFSVFGTQVIFSHRHIIRSVALTPSYLL